MTNGRPSQGQGKIVTFYSFKGGTGRTMALANVAWILAANGMRVLIADWDLESPGLYRFFQPFLDPNVSERPGIIDFIRRYEWAAVKAGIHPDDLEGGNEEAVSTVTALVDKHIDMVTDYAIPLNWQFPDEGALHFLSSGKQTNGDYQATLSTLNWDNFYNNLYGGQFFDALRALMKRNYDYVLIDSRTGLSDVADICTVHLPDVVVDCFTLATQGIEGAADVARMIQAHTARDITLLPVPMRIDHAQRERVEAGLELAARRFAGLPERMSEEQRQQYWAEVEVPYRASYAYEETLAAFADRPGTQTGLLPYYERITAQITDGAVTTLPPREEWVRLRTRLLFTRTQSSSPRRVVLDFSPADQLWAEWIAAVLASAEIAVQLAGEEPAGPDEADVASEAVAIGTDAYFSQMPDSLSAGLPDRLICVTDTRLPPQLTDVTVMFLTGLGENEAKERLIDWLGARRPADLEAGTGALRYPGGDRPQIVNIPGRNVNFTGRDDDLSKLREELRSNRAAAMLPMTILGRDGVGKTQVALEYAHRFRSDYDIVWWMNCGQAQYVDASLADLGQQMREIFKASVSEEGGVAEVARQVLQLLSEEWADRRWLLIYDNAEEIAEIRDLLPVGRGGHVLITSRDERWKDLGKSLEIGVFSLEESVSHLRRRMPDIADEEAGDLAKVLGRMPLAVAAAGALLASTGDSVAEYLQELAQQPDRVLPERHPLRGYPAEVAKVFDLSLDLLRTRSAAAARLLEICSAMAPDISLSLINTQAMADTLRELDPAITERAMIAMLIRQIDLLALIKLDNNARMIQVHRVVQAAVNERMSDEDKAAARRDVHQMMVAARPEGDVDDPQTWPRYRLIWPHLTPSGAMRSTEAPVRDLLIERVRYLRQRDDLERGARRAKEIEAAWQGMLSQALDPEMTELLQQQLYRLQFNLANILRDLAQFDEARAVDQAVLAGQTTHLGPEHPHTLATRSSLAADLRAIGDYQAALDLDLKTYDSWSKRYGDEYRGTLMEAHNLALSYLLTGDFRSALAQDRLTLERRTSVQGPRHPRTLNSGASVARDLLEAGRYVEAVSRMQAVWTLSRDVLGQDDRNTLNAQLLLGVAQRCAGSPDVAAGTIEAAMTGLTRGFGRDSTDALAARLSQALNQLALQHYEEARADAEEVLAVYERRGRDHPHSLICRLNIATALCLEGEYAAAETEARTAADGLEARLGESHPYTLAANMVLASVLANRRDLVQAEEIEQRVTNERERVLGPRHPDTLRCRANLLLTQHARGDEEAPGQRQAAIADLATLIGSEHPDVTTALTGHRLLCVIDPLPF
ncbi:MAG TPA: FxSxx-COOH system tetratricopeptide repeat protein [Streptosporangiaceae bacterium]|nr:FxSxx-COOH system tetratricopeptide repeat protein [Streptosporangiaceae bacterium]